MIILKKEVDLIIKVGDLFDSQTGEVVKNKTLIINDGKIEAIANLSDGLDLYDAAKLIAASDKFVMPALFDTHCHITPFVDTVIVEDGVPIVEIFEDKDLSKWHLKMMLYQGVTNVKNLGGFPKLSISLREEERLNQIQSPRILTSSKLMSERPLIFPAIVKEITSEDEARNYVHEMDSIGVDHIKLLFNLQPSFSKAAIEEAHKLDLKVAGHVKATSWQQALDMGIVFWFIHRLEMLK